MFNSFEEELIGTILINKKKADQSIKISQPFSSITKKYFCLNVIHSSLVIYRESRVNLRLP